MAYQARPDGVWEDGDSLLISDANRWETNQSDANTRIGTLETGSSAFTDEKAQDASAAMWAAGTHTGGTFVYDDASNSISFTSTVSDLVAVNTQAGTAYTLVIGDASKAVEMNNAAANTLTVPPNTSVAFPVGTIIEVFQLGAGQTTIAAGAGVTLRAPDGAKLAKQYASASLRKRATNEWILAGNTSV